MSTPAAADLSTTQGAVALERDAVRVQGPEASGFLQGQLSQDIAALAPGDSAASFLLQPSGKVDAWLRVTRLADEEFVLDVDAGWGDGVLARLQRFRLRTKADLDLARWSGYARRGPGAGPVTGAPLGGVHRLAAPLYGPDAIDVIGPQGAEVPPELSVVGAEALLALRIERGIPAMGAEIDEGTIPAELGQALIDTSVSFTKGCFTGQELVARIDSRGGNVPRPLRGLRLSDPIAVGDPVAANGIEVGRVTSAVPTGPLGPIALAIVARSVEVGATVHVSVGDRTVEAEVSGLPLR